MPDRSDEIATRGDLEHMVHTVAMKTQHEFYLEISRVESELRKEIKDTKRMLRDIHERLNKISLLSNPQIPYTYVDSMEPIWGEDVR